jgi:hypothetical protein
MLNTVFGTVWILAGIYIVVKPTALQKRLEKKGSRRLRAVLIAVGLFLSGTLVSFGWQHEGMLPKILMVLGIVGAIKVLVMVRGKGMAMMLALSAKIPPHVLRFGGACYIAIGSYLILFKK